MLLAGAVYDMSNEQMKTQFALWAFAKAPMILSADLNRMGNVNDTDTIASMINNPSLIAINQDKLGHQCEEIENVNKTGQNDTLGYYVSLNEEADTQDLYFALLIVNWYDEALTANTKLDFSAHGMALSSFDNCVMTNLWTNEQTWGYGGENEFPTANLAKHDHLAYKIKCSAF